MEDDARFESMTVTAESPSIFLATPCYGGQASASYMRSLLALRPACAARRVELRFELGGGEALIGRARAAMMAKFLASPASHLLFVDADIGFAPEAAFRLLAARREVVGGIYPTKVQPAGGPPTLEYDPLTPPDNPDAGGLVRVASLGAGFLLIARSAAARMVDAYPQLRARLGDVQDAAAPIATMVFDSFVEPTTGRYLADHQAFCHRWRAIGGDVWGDMEAGLEHVSAGSAALPLPVTGS